jgi:hypothetical protein
MIETPRLRLHGWDDRHRAAFAAMHVNLEVMADLRGTLSKQETSWCLGINDFTIRSGNAPCLGISNFPIL